MIMNYGACAVNLRTTSNTVDLTNWSYDVNYPSIYQGEKTVYLKKYLGNEINVVAPQIVI